jgi:hypothetical protein
MSYASPNTPRNDMCSSRCWSVRLPTLGQNFGANINELRNRVGNLTWIYQAFGVSGSPRSSSPQVIQCALLPCRGKVFPARLAVNQADDDVPHDRTPLFDPWVLIPANRFGVSSRDNENGFVIRRKWFRGFARMKQLHGFAITAVGRLARLTYCATHNATKRNMIAWRRCVSMLDAQIPSKDLSAEAVPRFDATQR